MEKLGRYVVKKRRKVLVISVLVTLVFAMFMSKLTINTRLMDLLPESDSTVLAYKNAEKNFTSLDSVVVGIEGQEEDIKNFIMDTAPVLSKRNGIKDVVYHKNINFFKKNGLILLDYDDLKNISPALGAINLKDFIAGINHSFENSYLDVSDNSKLEKDEIELLMSLNQLEKIIDGIKSGNVAKKDMENFFIGEELFISPDKSIGIYTIDTSLGMDEPEKVVELVNGVEEYLKDEAVKYGVQVSLSGSQVLLRDEMVVSQRDMEYSSFLSITLIFIIFISSFKGIRYSFMAITPLIFGIIWTLGLTYLIIGSLNIMTAMMGAILVGLGIDYSIHIISVYKDERVQGNSKTAVIKVFEKTMRGVVSAALTTSAGFFMFVFTDFPGFREFGIVLGIGVLSVLLASVFILPPLLIKFSKKSYLEEVIGRKKSKLEKLEKVLVRRKYATFFTLVAISILVARGMPNVEFEKDMMKIEAKGLESVSLNRKLVEKFNFSSDNSIIVSSTLGEAQKLYKDADKLKTVGEIESVGYYVPSDDEQREKQEFLKGIKEQIGIPGELDLDELAEELYRLEDNLVELSDLSYIGGEEKLTKKLDQLVVELKLSDLGKNIDFYELNVEKAQQILMFGLKEFLAGVNTDDKIEVEDLPENLKRRFVGSDGKYINILFPKDDLWQAEFQDAHIKEIDSLSPHVTGSAKIFLRVMEVVKEEGKRVLVLSFIAIYLILIADLKSIKYATLSIVPMIMTVIMMLGIMGWIGFKLDVVNIIAVPLIVGIGIDDGVHIVHRYRIEESVFMTIRSTGKAITLTTITTMAAFGTLMMSKYMGFVNFSILITMGVGLAYLMTLFFLFCTLAIVDGIGYKCVKK